MLFSFFTLHSLFGQCTIVAKRDFCLNDIGNFNANVTGGTVVSYDWDFGTFGTSSNTSPSIKFTATGKLVVSCTATLSGGQKYSDTHEIEILPLPFAKFKLDSSASLFCQNNNILCFNDSSKKASRPLYKVSMVWGDGKLSQFVVPYSKKWCHTFPDSGWYTNIMELEDSAGCKSQYSVNVYIFPSIKHNITYSEFPYCDSVKVCINNNVSGGNSITNDWYQMPGRIPVTASVPFCKVIQPAKSWSLKLVSSNEFQCMDSTTFSYDVPPSKFFMRKNRNKICSNELIFGSAKVFSSGEDVEWYLNGNGVGNNIGIDTVFYANQDAHVGWNYVIAKRIGGCTGYIRDSFEVLGIRAIGKTFNYNRRRIEDTVFMIDLTAYKPGGKSSRLWNFGDPKAEKCTTDTKLGIDINKNCNYSKDSIARHFYGDTNCYNPRLTVYDSSVGCFDDTALRVYRQDYCPEFQLPKTACTGQSSFFTMPLNMREKVGNNNFLITDINGTIDRDTLIMYFGFTSYKYKTNGTKSPVLWRYYDNDTVWTEKNGKIVVDFIRKGDGWVADTFLNAVHVDPQSNGQFNMVMVSQCDPFKVRLDFLDSNWLYPDTLYAHWGDTLEILTGFKDTIHHLKSLEHTFKTGGLYRIVIRLIPYKGCEGSGYREVRFSHEVHFRSIIRCPDQKVCFYDSILQLGISAPDNRWTPIGLYGELYWDFGDGTKDTGYKMCHTFPGIGTYIVSLAARNTDGCDVIAKDTIRVTGPSAKIRIPPPVYCSEIRQYFDSSFIVQPNNGQTINQWSWDFGDGTAKSPVKNPVHVFPGGGDYKIRLWVKTNLGCEDSTTAIFHVIGPEVFGKIISDSVGCNPLKVEFTNLSKQSRTYIWQYGDPANTVYSTKRDTNVNFTYKKAGTYYAKLVGGDSFYNPTTGSKYFCSITYPPAGKEALKIVVYETSLASFQIPDIFCVHDSVAVLNTAVGDAASFHWDMGNGDTFNRKKDTFLYKYGSSGKYKIRMYGNLSQATLEACKDTAEKEIQVVILNPDFKQECNPLKGSELVLKNLSDVQLNGYQWTLFDPEDSTEKLLDSSYDLIYDFGDETGIKWVCLGLKNDKVCGGKICKQVFVQGNVFIANVFTPGKDGYNDTYKVPMQGAKEFHMRIFNRWGELIFTSDDPKVEWNGNVFNTGASLPSGTYFYQLQYKPVCEDKLYTVNGSINLLR